MMVLPQKKRSIIFVLLVTLLTSMLGWTLNAAAMHDFDHELRVHGFSLCPMHEPGRGHTNVSDENTDITAHLSVHAAEHAQFFFLAKPMRVVAFLGMALFVTFVSISTPKLASSSLFRPPRNIFRV